MAIGIIGNLTFGKWVGSMSLSPDKLRALMVHKSIGITLLALVLLRLLWRLLSTRPAADDQMPRWQQWSARFTHELLYLCMVVMPVSGWVVNSAANVPMSWFGLFQIPDPFAAVSAMKSDAMLVHEVTAWVFIGLIVIHVAAALHHHFIRKDATLRRMLSSRSPTSFQEPHA